MTRNEATAAKGQRVLSTTGTSRRRLLADKSAHWFVAAGGFAIIASILGILVFILIEVAPLTRPAEIAVGKTLPLPAKAAGLIVDEHQTHAVKLAADGQVKVVRLDDGTVVAERSLLQDLPASGPLATSPEIVGALVPPGDEAVVAATSDGRLVAATVAFDVSFDDSDQRIVQPVLSPSFELELDPLRRPLGVFTAHVIGAEKAAAAAQLADGSLAVLTREVTTNAFTGEVSEASDRFALPPEAPVRALVLDQDSRNLFGGTVTGEILWWKLDGGEGTRPARLSTGTPVTSLAFLIGDRSLVVGGQNGSLSVWFPVRGEDDEFQLTRIRDFPRRPAPVTLIAASARNRTFFARDQTGGLGLYFSTSERHLWEGSSPIADATAFVFSPKGDGAYLAGDRELGFITIDNPHPETSLPALFQRVWYEGYEKPEYSWQSTGGTDDFESKLSLTPLIVGTLKGTFYSMLLAIPLGVFGAMFASQFLHPKLLNYVKPTVEVMAALPSVVLGFLAGLWLAPAIERAFPGLVLMTILVPLTVWLAGVVWGRLPSRVRNRWPSGVEVFLYLVVVAATLASCLALSPAFERLAFGGSFQAWLLDATGLAYDQRNAVVVGLAMGFAVIPIIFAISEDAFSSVPKNLVAGSLALGANRWQTVTRVVLPTASPGIFSAIMIGFGRAVGETMIVLMATGNTPIMEWNAFNGFRTLSANIAVEIPEAPHGGTLYRTLFLAALILFLLTFIVNTAAELVRQRLRRRYAQL